MHFPRTPRPRRPSSSRVVAVYDGRRLIGHVAACAGKYRAHRANGIVIGSFGSRREAMNAVADTSTKGTGMAAPWRG